MIFWQNVKRTLRKQGKTQIELCSLLNIPLQTLRGWIYKEIEPRLNDAVRIADYLGVTVDDLCGHPIASKNSEWEIFNSLSPDEQETVLSVAKALRKISVDKCKQS